jgi:hypothetical protein
MVRSRRIELNNKVAFIAPPFVILGISMMNNFNRGVRTGLPLAGFLAIWCGAAIGSVHGRLEKGVVVALAGLSIASGVFAYPNFLTYFNPLAGGTRNAAAWLVDSNLDWGQDLPELAKTLKRRGIDKVHLAYFGTADPKHWGINSMPARKREPGWYAISRTFLSPWPAGDPHAWLRVREPVELVGGSIALFHVE